MFARLIRLLAAWARRWRQFVFMEAGLRSRMRDERLPSPFARARWLAGKLDAWIALAEAGTIEEMPMQEGDLLTKIEAATTILEEELQPILRLASAAMRPEWKQFKSLVYNLHRPLNPAGAATLRPEFDALHRSLQTAAAERLDALRLACKSMEMVLANRAAAQEALDAWPKSLGVDRKLLENTRWQVFYVLHDADIIQRDPDYGEALMKTLRALHGELSERVRLETAPAETVKSVAN